ncbi:MAG: host attachment protein [Rhizobiaceae bacterium]
MKLKQNCWVATMDGEKALFLRNIGDDVHINLQVVRDIEHRNPSNREQSSDRPGRLNDGVTHHKSAVQETDWHRLEKDRFANEIANRLHILAQKGQFSELVLIAPPRTLGAVRKAIPGSFGAEIIAEFDKDLTSHTVADIEAHILKH